RWQLGLDRRAEVALRNASQFAREGFDAQQNASVDEEGEHCHGGQRTQQGHQPQPQRALPNGGRGGVGTVLCTDALRTAEFGQGGLHLCQPRLGDLQLGDGGAVQVKPPLLLREDVFLIGRQGLEAVQRLDQQMYVTAWRKIVLRQGQTVERVPPQTAGLLQSFPAVGGSSLQQEGGQGRGLRTEGLDAVAQQPVAGERLFR